MFKVLLFISIASATQMDTLNREQSQRLSAVRAFAQETILESRLTASQNVSTKRTESALQGRRKNTKRTLREIN